MKNVQLARLVTSLIGLALVLGLLLVGNVAAQSSAPSAPPAQQEKSQSQQPTPGATDRSAAPQPATPEARGDRSPSTQPSPNVTIQNRSEPRGAGGERGKILGVDATLAMVIGAGLLVVIVIALVAMTKRSEDVPTHRSV